MIEPSSHDALDIADELLDLILVHLNKEGLTQIRVALPILRHLSELEP
jgi:hypothetical protein